MDMDIPKPGNRHLARDVVSRAVGSSKDPAQGEVVRPEVGREEKPRP